VSSKKQDLYILLARYARI